jgi:predicted DsbA family dithiol-disulfide isomerase
MHDRLFESGGKLGPGDLTRYAQEIGLDLDRFVRDMRSEELAARVDEDVESAIESGVTGTPALYIEGGSYDGRYDAAALAEAIRTRA